MRTNLLSLFAALLVAVAVLASLSVTAPKCSGEKRVTIGDVLRVAGC